MKSVTMQSMDLATGFEVYNRMAVPNTQKLADCIECFELHSQNLRPAFQKFCETSESNNSTIFTKIFEKKNDIMACYKKVVAATPDGLTSCKHKKTYSIRTNNQVLI